MTKEDKNLLLKDLYARLPYGVKIQRDNVYDADAKVVETLDLFLMLDDIKYGAIERLHIKPYLRPILSMTDDEKKSYHILKDRLCEVCIHGTIKDIAYWTNALDLWFYKYHFDNANLIEKDLALEAPEGMYNN